MQIRSALRVNPFAKLLFFYLSGIVAGFRLPVNPVIWICLLIIPAVFLVAVLLITSLRPRYHTDKISGIASALLILATGLLNSIIHNQHIEKIHATSGFQGTVLMRIQEQVTETPRTFRGMAKIVKVYSAQPEFSKQQKILVYFEKDSSSKYLVPGDYMVAALRLNEIPGPGNPGEFDYRKYLASKRIINQAYIKSGSWHLSSEKHFSPGRLSFQLQQALILKYHSTGMNPKLFGILSAITLGYKNDLDAHTKQVFSKAGVMHVMALSGFNVAVIAYALNFLLFFTNRVKNGNYFRLVLIIVFIWFFAFVTGFSPSVTRATLMVSLVLTGKELRRNLSSTNILYASAFVLLALQPSIIYDVGFQLSFAAVFGIIVFQSPLENLVHTGSRILSMIWQLFTVSLAAQLATMPLTIAYFHQFPVYFWITNLYVVPLVSIIISTAMLFLMFSFIRPVMMIMGKILEAMVALLYKSISVIEILPGSVISDLHLGNFQLILLMLLLVAAGTYVYFRKRVLLIICLVLPLLIQIPGILWLLRVNQQQVMLIGQLRNSTFINLIEKRNSLILSETSPDNPQLKYSFGNFWVRHGIKSHYAVKLTDTCNLGFDFAGKSFLIVAVEDNHHQIHHADVIIIRGSVKPSVQYFSNQKPREVILDTSVKIFFEKKWIEFCRHHNIPCHSIRRDGAWIYTST